MKVSKGLSDTLPILNKLIGKMPPSSLYIDEDLSLEKFVGSAQKEWDLGQSCGYPLLQCSCIRGKQKEADSKQTKGH